MRKILIGKNILSSGNAKKINDIILNGEVDSFDANLKMVIVDGIVRQKSSDFTNNLEYTCKNPIGLQNTLKAFGDLGFKLEEDNELNAFLKVDRAILESDIYESIAKFDDLENKNDLPINLVLNIVSLGCDQAFMMLKSKVRSNKNLVRFISTEALQNIVVSDPRVLEFLDSTFDLFHLPLCIDNFAQKYGNKTDFLCYVDGKIDVNPKYKDEFEEDKRNAKQWDDVEKDFKIAIIKRIIPAEIYGDMSNIEIITESQYSRTKDDTTKHTPILDIIDKDVYFDEIKKMISGLENIYGKENIEEFINSNSGLEVRVNTSDMIVNGEDNKGANTSWSSNNNRTTVFKKADGDLSQREMQILKAAIILFFK